MKKRYNFNDQQKKTRCIQSWFENHFNGLIAYANGILEGKSIQGKDAEDFVIDVFINLDSLPLEKFDSIKSPAGYLRKSLRNMIYNAGKRIANYQKIVVNNPPLNPEFNPIINKGTFNLFQADCESLLKQVLTKDEFIILDMICKGYSYDEASAELGTNISTLRVRVARGRKKHINY